MSTPPPDDRRTFFKALLGEAAQSARELHVSLGPMSPLNRFEALAAIGAPDTDADDDRAYLESLGFGTTPAKAAQRTCSPDELVLMADGVGLGSRSDDIRALARSSVRLTHRPAGTFAPPGHSRLGGLPDLPSPEQWPMWDETPLQFLGQVDLSLLAGRDGLEALPDEGLMIFFFDHAGTASGLHPDDRGAARVLLVDPPAPEEIVTGDFDGVPGSPIDLSVELVLPRVKSAAVRALGLDPDEQRAWRKLRLALAVAQGVGPEGRNREDNPPAVHRLLGYPDETTGSMPLACELVARGHAVGDVDPGDHPAAPEAEPTAAGWQLLLQLSVDDDVDDDWSWADYHDRIYLWTPPDALTSGTLDPVTAFPR
jgi:Domain of unknown function (DUF1963)